MSQASQIVCPNCGQSYNVTAEQWPQYAGQTINCTKCQQPFTVGAGQDAGNSPPPPQPVAPGAAYAPAPTVPNYASYISGVPRQTNGLAIASLVTGILGCVPFCSPVALVLGIVGLRRTKDPTVDGKGLAIAGLVLGAVGTLSWLAYVAVIAVVVFAMPRVTNQMGARMAQAQETASRAACAANLRQIGASIMLYSNNNAGAYPPDLDTLAKAQSMTPQAFICPSSSDTASTPNNESYVYVGAALSSSSPVKAVLAYEPIAHHHDGIHVLFNNGRVAFKTLTPRQMAAFEQQLQAGQNPPAALGP